MLLNPGTETSDSDAATYTSVLEIAVMAAETVRWSPEPAILVAETAFSASEVAVMAAETCILAPEIVIENPPGGAHRRLPNLEHECWGTAMH